MQPQTRASAGQASSDDCDYPTGRSGPSKSPQPPSWGGNEQSRQTSRRTVEGNWRKILCEMVGGGLFDCEEETASHINSAPPGNHKATVQRRVSRTACNRHRLSLESLTAVYCLKLEI